MKSPRIILVCGKNPLTEAGGYASYTYNLAKTLSQLKYKIIIYCSGTKNKIIDSPVGKVQVVKSNILRINYFNGVEMALFPLLSIRLGAAILNQLEEDTVVWGVGPWSMAGVVVKLFSRKKISLYSDYFTSISHEFRGTLAATRADYGIWQRSKNTIIYHTIVKLYSLFEQLIFIFSDKVIVHYKSTQKILLKQFGVRRNKFLQLPYSVNIEIKNKSDRLTNLKKFEKPFILLVTRHDARKGINFLLRAFKLLDERGIKYSAAIIGRGKMLEANKRLANKLKLKNVSMLGYVDNLKPYFRYANIYVFPSCEEGSSSISILEAMEAGMPIVSTNVDGIPEDLTDGKSALLVPPSKPKALADALEKSINNPKLANRLGSQAKKDYIKKHNPEIVKKAISNLISSQVSK